MVGNSLTVFLPPKLLNMLGWDRGTEYVAYISEDGKEIRLVRVDGAKPVAAAPAPA